MLFDFLEDAPAAINLLLGCRDALAEADRDGLANVLAFGLAERHSRVVVLDRGLYEVDGLVALRALAALVARTNEVLVVAAVAFVAGVDETAAAGAAADGALEVVLVLAVALAG
ncbi:MAG TPA: hypothetical protein VK778_16875 [Solirubrobacteraceae bacterium]|nr:hypothetical protein [Solirubrobacteraceae bacterium]